MSLHELLIEPLTFPFMLRAFAAVILIGVVCGVMGAYVVTRRMAFLGDAMAHTILPGVAIGYVATGGSTQAVLLGGLIAGAISALGIGFLSRSTQLSEDTAIGVIFAGALALGIGIISLADNYSADLSHLLIGNVLAVNAEELTLIALVSAVVLAVIVLLYKEFLVISFDENLAQTLKLPSQRLRMLMLLLLAGTVVISLQAVGVAMVAAMLVTPAATARFYTRHLHHLMLLAATIGAVGGVIGMYITWHVRIAPSAGIVLTLTACFIVSFLFAPQKGYVWKQRGVNP
jgi:manganese/iron transport system permease protein